MVRSFLSYLTHWVELLSHVSKNQQVAKSSATCWNYSKTSTFTIVMMWYTDYMLRVYSFRYGQHNYHSGFSGKRKPLTVPLFSRWLSRRQLMSLLGLLPRRAHYVFILSFLFVFFPPALTVASPQSWDGNGQKQWQTQSSSSAGEMVHPRCHSN